MATNLVRKIKICTNVDTTDENNPVPIWSEADIGVNSNNVVINNLNIANKNGENLNTILQELYTKIEQLENRIQESQEPTETTSE